MLYGNSYTSVLSTLTRLGNGPDWSDGVVVTNSVWAVLGKISMLVQDVPWKGWQRKAFVLTFLCSLGSSPSRASWESVGSLRKFSLLGFFVTVYPSGIERSSRHLCRFCGLSPGAWEGRVFFLCSLSSGILLKECQRKALCLGIICLTINSERGARGKLVYVVCLPELKHRLLGKACLWLDVDCKQGEIKKGKAISPHLLFHFTESHKLF